MDNICPPKAEATGSNPVGCATFSATSGDSHQPHACRTAQEHARSKPERAYNPRTEAEPDPRDRIIMCNDRGRTTWMLLRFSGDSALATPIEAPSRADFPHLSGALCYFIGGESGPVKIGHSRDPWGRRELLQSGSPVELQVLAVCEGGAQAEAEYHRKFAATRLHGEWFKRTRALTAEIDRHQVNLNRLPAPRQRDGLPQTVGGSNG